MSHDKRGRGRDGGGRRRGGRRRGGGGGEEGRGGWDVKMKRRRFRTRIFARESCNNLQEESFTLLQHSLHLCWRDSDAQRCAPRNVIFLPRKT